MSVEIVVVHAHHRLHVVWVEFAFAKTLVMELNVVQMGVVGNVGSVSHTKLVLVDCALTTVFVIHRVESAKIAKAASV
jgi:hypothetical protein